MLESVVVLQQNQNNHTLCCYSIVYIQNTRVAKRIQLKLVQSQPYILTQKVTVSGWGLLNDGGNAAKKLQEVDLEVLSCSSLIFGLLQKHMIKSHANYVISSCPDNLDERV